MISLLPGHSRRRGSGPPWAAGYAQSRLAPDLFILDDGMQHLAVRRDLDLVLLRPEDLRGSRLRAIE
jgi:tetraacyldisaccharide 4'-kinase